MKFYFEKKKVQRPRNTRALSLHKRCSIEKMTSLKTNPEKERIDLFGVFEQEEQKKREGILKKLKKAFAALIRPRRRKKAKKWTRPRRPPANTARIFGAVCGAVAITLCAAVSTLALLFGRYAGSYTEVVIPSFISLSSKEALSVQNELFEYSLLYSFNPECEANEIISQSPSPNVVRKLYSSKQKIRILLTVNKPKEAFILPKTVGTRARDAQLLLKNAGIGVLLLEEYSDTAPQGTVIACSHPEGSALSMNDRVVLTSSKGPQTRYIQMPDLVGLGESEAVERLRTLGFNTDSVTYSASSSAVGTVISQSHNAGDMLAEGTAISLTVSAGKYFQTDD